MITELDRRQPLLTRFAFGCLALAILTALLQVADPRAIADAPVWAKPTRFFLSIGVFALTAAWFYGDVAEARRDGRLLRGAAWALVGAGGFELAYITLQAARGEASHFNFSSPLASVMYGLMGVGAVILVGTTLPLAWSVARHPAPGRAGHYRLAVVVGLALTFILGGGMGGYMSAANAHSVGQAGGALPMTGWNRLGGDLRVAHFLGLHAEQILPAVALMVGAVLPRGRRLAVIGAAGLLSIATMAAVLQATAGRPLV